MFKKKTTQTEAPVKSFMNLGEEINDDTLWDLAVEIAGRLNKKQIEKFSTALVGVHKELTKIRAIDEEEKAAPEPTPKTDEIDFDMDLPEPLKDGK